MKHTSFHPIQIYLEATQIGFQLSSQNLEGS